MTSPPRSVPYAATAPQVSILIPAHNEAAYIASCLQAVFASDPLPEGQQGEVLLLANGCNDATVANARAAFAAARAEAPHWHLTVLDLPEGGKLKALNAGDAVARGRVLIYLDADVTVDPALIGQLTRALSTDQPRYASGTPQIAPAQSALTRAYGRFWTRLPFVQQGVPGFGLFAMNRAGRRRWQDWPDIIADDSFARLSFSPSERIKLPGKYHWPLVEGFRNLTRVRRRQNAGVAELAETHPKLLENDDKANPNWRETLHLFGQDPSGFAAYALVTLAVKTPLFRSTQRWTRGR